MAIVAQLVEVIRTRLVDGTQRPKYTHAHTHTHTHQHMRGRKPAEGEVRSGRHQSSSTHGESWDENTSLLMPR